MYVCIFADGLRDKRVYVCCGGLYNSFYLSSDIFKENDRKKKRSIIFVWKGFIVEKVFQKVFQKIFLE